MRVHVFYIKLSASYVCDDAPRGASKPTRYNGSYCFKLSAQHVCVCDDDDDGDDDDDDDDGDDNDGGGGNDDAHNDVGDDKDPLT